ncbi:NYN domain-containing protein [Candidatus Viadribacter manganicus]|uniref:NYN domain-containing protein n=1 Tax=Candidatus Viadribacter manganicus TaxID=1759059 RepID=A0A1B1AI78_9PROT|nr:NYN domain-containing protein [Candidatus Viadribacter manganicus]ANP46258.1 hypothetical protein ATE48_10180 [Candidatus Viadribacter manganicus]
MTIRAAFYVDGFNVYHALKRLEQPHLKWLDWHALGTLLIPSRSETLEKVVICTAITTTNPGKQDRHRRYITALESKGVVCLRGHFADEERKCPDCSYTWEKPVEKQGDVNLALSVIDDAHRDNFDHCYLVTADGDQVATAKLLKQRFPAKRLTTLVITGHRHNHAILHVADAKITISENHLERCVFPKLVPGTPAVIRPSEYDPPADWVHPSQRPT